MDTPDSTTVMRKCKRCGNEFPITPEHWYKDKKARFGLGYCCKSCARQKANDWMIENRERNKETCRNWYANNKTAIAEYRLENAEHIAESKRQWRKDNPDKVKKHKSDSQKRNRASANVRSKRFRERHPDKLRMWTRVGQHRRRHAVGTFTAQDVELLHRSQRGKCWWCGKPLTNGYHIDHRIPLARGGSNAPENLCLACPSCNMSKGAKLPHEWNGRLL